METKFTKGEWIVENNGTSYSVWVEYGSNYDNIINEQYYSFPNKEYSDELLANVHLIAAAPEMYAMIESLSRELELAITKINITAMRNVAPQAETQPDMWDMESLHDAQLLLKKARGE